MTRRTMMPEPPPRRRRGSTRTERFKMWRTRGPVGKVTVTRQASIAAPGEHGDGGESDGGGGRADGRARRDTGHSR